MPWSQRRDGSNVASQVIIMGRFCRETPFRLPKVAEMIGTNEMFDKRTRRRQSSDLWLGLSPGMPINVICHLSFVIS